MHKPEDEHSFDVSVNASNHFAWIRTRLALERTLMAWARTSVALIGFGFTIVQFFERFVGMEGVEPARRPQAPRYLGLALIGAGICALTVSVVQYRSVLRYLWGDQFSAVAGIEPDPMRTPLLAVTIALIGIGTFAFISVLTRAI